MAERPDWSDRSDVVYFYAGRALKAQLRIAAEQTGMTQKAIAKSALELQMKALARRVPKLQRFRKALAKQANGDLPEIV